MDMRVVNQSNTVGDEHEHSLNTSCDGKSHVSVNLHKKKPKVTLIQETQCKYFVVKIINK